MQPTKTLLRTCVIVTAFGLATLALPLAAQAGVRVSIGVGVPVYPAPVVVAPAPVVVAAPPSVVYESAPVVVGGYYGPYYRPWRHHHHRWHRW
jgi:hypothetical protein